MQVCGEERPPNPRLTSSLLRTSFPRQNGQLHVISFTLPVPGMPPKRADRVTRLFAALSGRLNAGTRDFGIVSHVCGHPHGYRQGRQRGCRTSNATARATRAVRHMFSVPRSAFIDGKWRWPL